MNTMENENAAIAEAPRSIEDIKASYPEEWIVIGNTVFLQRLVGDDIQRIIKVGFIGCKGGDNFIARAQIEEDKCLPHLPNA